MSELDRGLKAIPSVDRLLATAPLARLGQVWQREPLRRWLQIRLDEYRLALRSGEIKALDRDSFLAKMPSRWAREWTDLAQRGTRRVINGTGVLLHTNLGRAALGKDARDAVMTAARWPVDLEQDLSDGRRAPRTRKAELLLRCWSGAEAAFVVNNNAAALTLAVDTLARRRRLIVSRGEQVEIGGSFRLPEILERFAGRMVEVGTTNRSRLSDYSRAITRRGDVLLKVHRSNFRVEGYVEEASLEDLVELGRQKSCPVIYDLGSGTFDAGMGRLGETPFAEVLAAGADLVTFSGDKIFGGPQAGIILGSAGLIAEMRANPLARALRVDKLTLAALQETLSARMALEGQVPTRDQLLRSRSANEDMARQLIALLRSEKIPGLRLALSRTEACSGGGAAPGASWPSSSVRVSLKGVGSERLAVLFRHGRPAVLGRVRRDDYQIDMASLAAEEIPLLARTIAKLARREAKR